MHLMVHLPVCTRTDCIHSPYGRAVGTSRGPGWPFACEYTRVIGTRGARCEAPLMFMRKRDGFSLIELLIVIAIILLIAAIAIPNLLRARMAANESSAVASIRSISIAETAYYTAFPTVGFAVQIQDLGRTAPCTPTPIHACLLDDNLANAV